MFQFWKGNYTKISNGAEIGLYNRAEDSKWLYESVPDEEMLYMSFELFHGDELVASNGPSLHWWLTAFRPGKLIDSDDLTLKSNIKFTDPGMLEAFVSAAKKAFGRNDEVTVNGMTVSITWN